MLPKTGRIGEVGISKWHGKMKIIKYTNVNNIIVEFNDKSTLKTSYRTFKSGGVRKKLKRVGMTGTTNEGYKMKIIEYNSSKDVLIRLENGYEIRTEYKCFKNKGIRNPMHPSKYGVGFIGIGEYSSLGNTKKEKHCAEYIVWSDIIRRCYDPYYINKHLVYKDCVVCNEWKNFQNFAKWYKENYYEVEGQRSEIDKDILSGAEKEYSPKNCCIVPKIVNTTIIDAKSFRGKFPVGVDFNKASGKFRARISCIKKSKSLGYFSNPIDAFYAYKKAKEKQIKNIARKYYGIIPYKAYCALMSWEIKITD